MVRLLYHPLQDLEKHLLVTDLWLQIVGCEIEKLIQVIERKNCLGANDYALDTLRGWMKHKQLRRVASSLE